MRYFAYGSNMDQTQLESRVGPSTLIGIGYVEGYSFRINARGVATIVPCAESTVYGTVWDLSDKQLMAMDRFEGVALGHYRRATAMVRVDGKTQPCATYIALVDTPGQSRLNYLDRIIACAINLGLPKDYVEALCTWTNR